MNFPALARARRSLLVGTLGLALATPALAQWSIETLPTPRDNLLMTAANGKVYFAGGRDALDQASKHVDVYDEATGTWSALKMPSPLWWGGAATIGGKLYFGTGKDATAVTDVVHVYDTVAGTWTTEYVSQPRIYTAVVAVGKFLVVAGGNPLLSPPGAGTYGFADVYDTSTSSWSLVPLHQSMSEMAGAAAAGRVLLGGGRNEFAGYADRLQDVDPIAGTSSVPGSGLFSLSAPRVGISSGSVGPNVYFVGGIDSSYHAADEYEVYNAFTDTLTTGTLPVGLRSGPAAVAGNKLVVAGGAVGSLTTPTPSELVYVFDVDGQVTPLKLPTDTSQNPPAPFKVHRLSSASTGRAAYFAGGIDANSNIVDTVFIYRPQLDKLIADTVAIPLGAGGSANFSLDSGPSFAGDLYILLGSLSGTAPGLKFDGLKLPLNPDPYFTLTLQYPNAPPLTHSLGPLDGTGSAAAKLVIPPGSSPKLANLPVHHAYLVFDLVKTQVVDTSNAVTITLLP